MFRVILHRPTKNIEPNISGLHSALSQGNPPIHHRPHGLNAQVKIDISYSLISAIGISCTWCRSIIQSHHHEILLKKKTSLKGIIHTTTSPPPPSPLPIPRYQNPLLFFLTNTLPFPLGASTPLLTTGGGGRPDTLVGCAG